MKKQISFFAILLFLPFSIFATTWTVSNNVDIPAQFTQISSAILDARTGEGDTLLVAGSSVVYAAFTLNKPFVIIGAGINNPYGYTTSVGQVTLATTSGFTPSGTKLIGLNFNSYVYFYTSEGLKTIENVLIERCQVNSYIFLNGATGSVYRNDTIRNCLIKGQYIQFDNYVTYDNILIHNNLFDYASIYQSTNVDLSKVILSNNVFINRSSDLFTGIKNAVINDNIFFKSSPQGCSGCTFTNNTSYGSLNNVLPGAANLGSGNAVRDPKFVNYSDAAGAFAWTSGYDFHLTVNSLDDDSGTAGTQRGMYGGIMPVELGSNPAIPQMTEVSFPDNASSVKEGGTLNVRLKAKKQN